ncbi:hypothetical protein QCD60_08580 [Pokkaliibacter sp. MBI-7]|uniref:hypothetical protein n=1 Tax=Pokkaliibacter sp. MBI-7 TaxID=3040600 RepID=UPI0024480FCA|nr:hypothetical protein [Pokkaliibacter sp. MBI-7]MDH2432621.1 hypothetical protein [Pokkaliibacter sp. MBI-7]
MHYSFEDYLLLVFGAVMLSFCFSLLIFSRFSMKRIERKMVQEGLELPSWDGWRGYRVGYYAFAIVWHYKAERMPLINAEATRRLATKTDWYLALWTVVSGAGLMICVAILKIFFDD